MTLFSAKTPDRREAERLVVFVVYPNIVLLDLVGPLQVFSHAPDPSRHKNGYECLIVSETGGLISTNTVAPVPTVAVSEVTDRQIDTLVIVGGDGAYAAMEDPALLGAVKRLALRSTRVCSVCSGALVLAAAGLLSGRRAVTHWEDCEQLEDRFPDIRVEVDPIYVKDGDVWTSAGVTAGIDMALAIVSEDLGRGSAMYMARSMVTHMVRAGGQSQFSPNLRRQSADMAGRFDALHDWIQDNLHKALPVDVLAGQAGMSPRNFARVYSKIMSMPPAKAVEVMRVEKARDLLESSALSIKQIAAACGFHDEERMRRAFLRRLHVSPSEYRCNFRVS